MGSIWKHSRGLLELSLNGDPPVLKLRTAKNSLIVAVVHVLSLRLGTRLSVTLRQTLFVPATVYAWLGVAPEPAKASPKSHTKVKGSPSGSDEPVPSKYTGVPMTPKYGPPAFALGGRFTLPTTIRSVADPDKSFAAVTVTSWIPFCENVGIQLNVPDLWSAFATKVAPTGRGPDVREVIGLSSGS